MLDPYRIQAAIDITRWIEWIIRRVSVVAAILVILSLVFNYEKLEIFKQIGWAFLCILAMNLGVTGLHRLFQSLRS